VTVDRLPWGKFVWAHWENDEALALCSMAAQGFWMRLLCIAVKEGGYVLIGGKSPTAEKLARIVRSTPEEVQSWLEELEAEGVFSRTGRGEIYSRRMVREAKLARRNRENGSKGGNPKLRKDAENDAWDNHRANPHREPPAADPVKAEEEKEKIREESSDPNGSAAGAASGEVDDLADLRALDLKAGSWRLALKVLMSRGQYPEARARPLVGKWAKDLGAAELWQVSESAWKAGTLDPVSYITAAIERLKSESDDPLKRPTEARQRLWMEDYRAAPLAWREHERGPPPGQPGCRVSPEIQREFGIEPAAPQPVRGAA
jgi:hypothetical protein